MDLVLKLQLESFNRFFLLFLSERQQCGRALLHFIQAPCVASPRYKKFNEARTMCAYECLAFHTNSSPFFMRTTSGLDHRSISKKSWISVNYQSGDSESTRSDCPRMARTVRAWAVQGTTWIECYCHSLRWSRCISPPPHLSAPRTVVEIFFPFPSLYPTPPSFEMPAVPGT